MKRWLSTMVLAMTCVVVLGLAACGEKKAEIPVAEALPYQVIKKEQEVVQQHGKDRKVTRWAIYAEGASTVKQRVHTALKAAKDAHAETGADYAEATLLAGPSELLLGTGKLLAMGQYAPDGLDGTLAANKLQHGSWEARMTEYQISEQERKITLLWFENRKRFDRAGPFGLSQVDEPAIKAFIGQQLGIPADEVTMTLWQTYKYFPD